MEGTAGVGEGSVTIVAGVQLNAAKTESDLIEGRASHYRRLDGHALVMAVLSSGEMADFSAVTPRLAVPAPVPAEYLG